MLHPSGPPNQKSKTGLKCLHRLYAIKSVSDATVESGTSGVINTSRGPLIDESALVKALKTSRVACAGLDVFCTEPLAADSELLQLENVTLSDHNGWYSAESMVELKTKAARNIPDALTKGTPTYPVKT